MSIFDKAVSDFTITDVSDLLSRKAVENIRLEFKADLPAKDEILKKLSSFANTYGGYVVLGAKAASADGRLLGLPGIDQQSNLRQQVVQWCYDGIWPPLEVFVSDPLACPASPKKVCYILYVPESLEAPHFLNGRKGAYLRTDEFSQRFDAQLATYDELQHLSNRRSLLISRRSSLLLRARQRFDSFADINYVKQPGASGSLGATTEIAMGPTYPARQLLQHQELLSTVSSLRIPWRTVGFPHADPAVTQLESVLLPQPFPRYFSLLDLSVWGQLFCAWEIEEIHESKDGKTVNGIHMYALLGYILAVLKYCGSIYSRLSYDGPLNITLRIRNIRERPFLYALGNRLVSGPSSPVDNDVEFDLSSSTFALEEKQDGVAADLFKIIFFALNWPEVASSDDQISKLIGQGAIYNGWDRAD